LLADHAEATEARALADARRDDLLSGMLPALIDRLADEVRTYEEGGLGGDRPA
jgi:hypothetical protein